MNRILYTIGHSVHTSDRFMDLVGSQDVSAICDVRSRPYSRRSPHFNRESLRAELDRHGIAYVFLGNELGGRSSDPACYENGRVDYCRVAATLAFRQGLQRLLKGIEQFNVALLCAEKDPLACHRTLLVCRHLRSPDLSIRHILDDGSIESHEAAERRLIEITGLPQGDLFSDRAELLERAYDRHGLAIAYSIPETGAGVSTAEMS